jgi:tetratricopeptide (TPR) repeat protein
VAAIENIWSYMMALYVILPKLSTPYSIICLNIHIIKKSQHLFADNSNIYPDKIYLLRMPLSKAQEYFKLGTTLAAKGDFYKALEYFEKSIAIDPEYLDAYNNEGLVYVKLNSFEMAEKTFEKAISRNPNYLPALQNLGALMLMTRNFDKALEFYDRYVAIQPLNADAWKDRGDAIVGQVFGKVTTEDSNRKYKDAYDSYSKALDLNPKKHEAKKWACISLNQINHHLQSVECFRKYLEMNAADDQTLFFYAQSLQQLKQYNEALKVYDQTIELSTSEASKKEIYKVLNNKGLIFKELKNYQQAFEVYNQLTSQFPAYAAG